MPGWAIAGSAVLGYLGSKEAGNSAREAAAINAQTQREINTQNINFTREMNSLRDPFSMGNHRAQYVDQLNSFLAGNVGDIYTDPVFANNLQMGQEARNRTFGAAGSFGSGANQIDLMQYTTGQAQGAYKDKLARLMSLSGASSPNIETPRAQNIPGMDPTTAYGITAAPYQAIMSGANTLAGIYGRNPGGGDNPYNTPDPRYESNTNPFLR